MQLCDQGSFLSRHPDGDVNAHIDVYLLGGHETESGPPIRRIDLGPRMRLFMSVRSGQFLFGHGRMAFVYEERDGCTMHPWKVVLIDEKWGQSELEKMRECRQVMCDLKASESDGK